MEEQERVYQVFPAEGQRGGKQGNHSGGNDSPFVGGAEKRKNALGLLKALEPMADALYTVDYDDSVCHAYGSVSGSGPKIIEFTDSLLGMVLRRCMITFDFNDFRTFLQFPTPSKHIDFLCLSVVWIS